MMFNTLVALLLLTRANLSYSIELNSKFFHRIFAYDDVMFADGFLEEVTSELSCARLCLGSPTCNLISYQALTKRCRLHAFDEAMVGQGLNETGWQHYGETCPSPGDIAGSCWDEVNAIAGACVTCFKGQVLSRPPGCVAYEELDTAPSYADMPSGLEVTDGMSIIFHVKSSPGWIFEIVLSYGISLSSGFMYHSGQNWMETFMGDVNTYDNVNLPPLDPSNFTFMIVLQDSQAYITQK